MLAHCRGRLQSPLATWSTGTSRDPIYADFIAEYSDLDLFGSIAHRQPLKKMASESKGRVLLAYSGGLGECKPRGHTRSVALTIRCRFTRYFLYLGMVDRARLRSHRLSGRCWSRGGKETNQFCDIIR